MQLHLDVDGHTVADLEHGLEDALRLLRQGNLCGFRQRTASEISYTVTGEPVAGYAHLSAGTLTPDSPRFVDLALALQKRSPGVSIAALNTRGDILYLVGP